MRSFRVSTAGHVDIPTAWRLPVRFIRVRWNLMIVRSAKGLIDKVKGWRDDPVNTHPWVFSLLSGAFEVDKGGQ